MPRGEDVPPQHPEAQVVRVPVRRVVALSTTYLVYLDAADLIDRLVGLSNFKHVNTESVRQRIEAGGIKEVGNFSNLHIETLLDLSPDVIFTHASGSIYDVHPKLKEAGLPTALVLDSTELHPLGRCEWVSKYLALFFNTLLISILHPQLLPKHELVYYRQLVPDVTSIEGDRRNAAKTDRDRE